MTTYALLTQRTRRNILKTATRVPAQQFSMPPTPPPTSPHSSGPHLILLIRRSFPRLTVRAFVSSLPIDIQEKLDPHSRMPLNQPPSTNIHNQRLYILIHPYVSPRFLLVSVDTFYSTVSKNAHQLHSSHNNKSLILHSLSVIPLLQPPRFTA
jgi:hypothetical protein